MSSEIGVAGQAEAQWVASQRRWTSGWRRFLAPSAFLVYLLYVLPGIAKSRHPLVAVLGYVILAAFAVCFLALIREAQDALPRLFWSTYLAMFALLIAELPIAGYAAFVMCLYITAISVSRFDKGAIPVVVVLALAALFVPAAIPAWHQNVKDAFDSVTPVAVPVVALASFGVRRIFEGNRVLSEARGELARLTAENERIRIARDLHDLLGHSLTTITVKAGLARQIGEVDPARALQEIAEVETIARRSLSDVRAAVTNYREVTLAGELATGRELLRAAGIRADLPGAIDITDPTQQELFGWTGREGLTNVVRHARASSCAVRLSTTSVEIVDDGIGGEASSGNGLQGLRERVAAAGGAIDAGPQQPRGWRLRVSLPPKAAPR